MELTIKLSKRCSPFAVALRQNPHKNLYHLLEQLVKEQPSFPVGSNSKKLFKNITINWTSLSQTHKNLVTQQKVDGVAVYRRTRLELLSAIVNGAT